MLVSVLINNYNYGKYLDICLKSVLQQTYLNVEVIVFDDGSTDESLNILEKYKNQIKIISKSNYGQTPNINQMNAVYQAFLKSKGDIIFLLDSDDYFHYEKIEKIIEVFETNPDIDVIQHPLVEINSEGQLKNKILPVLKKVNNYKNYIFSTHNIFHLFVPTSGLAFKRSFLEKMLPLEEDELSTICVDTRLMLISALKGYIKTINQPLAYYRIHGSNNFSKIGDVNIHQQYIDEIYKYFNKVSLKTGYGDIEFNKSNFLENTFFYPLIDLDKVNQFILNTKTKHEHWIWGAGEAGQTLLYSLKNESQKVKGFIDMDPQKRHAIVMDKKVLHPEEVEFLENMKILVSSYHAYEEISKYLRSVGLVEGVNFIFPYKN